MPTTTASTATQKTTGNNTSSAGDFSAQFSKLFNASHSNSSKSSDAASAHEQKRSKPPVQDASLSGPRSAGTTVVASTPAVQPQVSQLSVQNQTGAALTGTPAESEGSFNFSIAMSTEPSGQPSYMPVGAAPNGALQTSDSDTAPLDASSGADAAGGAKAADGISEATSDASSNVSGNDGGIAAQLGTTYTSTPAPATETGASAALLATTQARGTKDGLPDTDSTAVNVTWGSSKKPLQVGQAGDFAGAPSNAHKTSSKPEPPPVALAPALAQNSEALSKSAQVPVMQQNHMMPADPGVKTSAAKQGDKTDNPVVFDRDASLQNSIESNAVPTTVQVSGINAVNVADGSSTDQNSSSASDSDRRSKDDGVSGVVPTAMPVLSALQNLPTIAHTAGTAASHTAQDTPVAASAPGISGNVGSAAASGKVNDLDPSTASDVKSVVSTSKLLQTLNQSEMRVGLRTSEFGDISIHTSAAHDSMLTQISLDHAELAKSLATHIPDLQARLASHGNHEVRIHAGEQGFGSNSSMSDARSGSGGSQQDSSYRPTFTPSYGNSGFFDSAVPTAATTNSLPGIQNDGRLDIQA